MDNKVFLKEETVISIADAIREKSGSSEKMTPAQMAVRIQNLTVGGSEDLINDLNAIHGEEAKNTTEEAITTIEENVSEQAGLISQIQTVLQNKAAGGGGDIPMCELTVEYAQYVDYVTVENGVVTTKTSTGADAYADHTLSVCQGSIFVARQTRISLPNANSYGTTTIYQQSSSGYYICVSSVNIGTDIALCSFGSQQSGGAT